MTRFNLLDSKLRITAGIRYINVRDNWYRVHNYLQWFGNA